MRYFFQNRSLILFFLLMLCSVCINCSAKNIIIYPNTPFLLEPNIKSSVVAISRKAEDVKILDKTVIVQNEHPLIRKVAFYKVKLPIIDNPVWVAPLFVCLEKNGKMLVETRKFIDKGFKNFQYISLAVLIVLIGFVLCFFYTKKYKEGKTGIILLTAGLIGILIFLRLFLVSYMLSKTQNIYTFPADEVNYAKIASNIFNFNFSAIDKWHYTYGYSLFLLPLMFFYGSGSYYSLVKEICIYNSFIISSLNICFLYLILKFLSKSNYRAFIATFVFIISAFVLLPKEYWPVKFFNVVVELPKIMSNDSYTVYNILYNLDFVGLSHVVSMFLFLLFLYICLVMKARYRNVILVAVIFTLACLTRMDSILFAPLVGFLFWTKFKDKIISNKIVLFEIIILSVVTFLIIYSPQFLENYCTRGSIFASPYELHAIAKKIIWAPYRFLKIGIDYQVSVTFIYIVLGVTGLLFIKNNYHKVILIFWCFSFYFFYCGYCDVGNNPFRFVSLTFSGMISAFFLANVWDDLNWKNFLFVLIPIVLCIICIVPRFQYLTYYVNLNVQYLKDYVPVYDVKFWSILVVYFVGVIYFVVRKNKNTVLFMLIFLALFLSALSYLLFVFMLTIYIYALLVWIRDIWVILICRQGRKKELQN